MEFVGVNRRTAIGRGVGKSVPPTLKLRRDRKPKSDLFYRRKQRMRMEGWKAEANH